LKSAIPEPKKNSQQQKRPIASQSTHRKPFNENKPAPKNPNKQKCHADSAEKSKGLKKLLPKNCHQRVYESRRQHFRWVNDIDYYYDIDKMQVFMG
jgi:hypothetical protein